ncbi:MAG: hypothetical protein K6F93_06275 [Lachnospiraceae bacterium]|nr:hypothetical protein [Lachnospiraceae bacterium]
MRIEAGNKKKTTLSDDSKIYQKREERSAKETFKSLNKKEKWQYFKDYILGKLLLGIAIVGILIYAGVTIFGPKVEPVFYGAVFANPFTERDLDKFKGGFSERVINDPDLEGVYFDTGFTMGDGGDSAGRYKFVTLLGAAEIDALISPMDELVADVNGEACVDLRTILPDELYKRVEDKLFWIEPEVFDYDTETTVKMPSAPYAIDMSDFVKKYSSYDVRLKYYYAVIINGQHKENAVRFIEYMADCLDGKVTASVPVL